jgi:hypothetical protein
LDYVVHSKVDKNLLTLAERRWDMYHILSSTLLALCVAGIAGMAFRVYYQISFFEGSFSSLSTAEAQTEAVALIFTTISVVFLLIFLWRGRKWILAMSASLHEARIRSSDVEPEDLKKAFKSLYDKYACKHDRYGKKIARA